MDVDKVSLNLEDRLLTTVDSGMRPVLYPNSVAVIGATEREKSVGRTIVENLVKSCKGNFKLYGVNPKAAPVLGVPCFAKIADCPTVVEHAIIVIASKFVPAVTEECGKAGVKVITVISAGFKEVGEEGAALEKQVVDTCNRYNMRCIGPNCLGVMSPKFGMNATFAARCALEGNLAFISQSGAMCTAALDWSIQQKVGFSAFISIGSMADVEWADLIAFLGDDPSTSAVLIYMETIGTADAFISACRRVSPKKPIIVLKAGKSAVAAEAAASHTGSLAGSHESFLAAMKRSGVLVVDSISELFATAVVVDKQPSPKGPNLVIVTNAGGPGVLATDACACNGGTIVPINDATVKELSAFLPAAWSQANPIDILGDASAEVYAKSMEVALKDPNADGVLIILSPQSVTEPLETAKAVVKAAKSIKGKTIITSWMGGVDVQQAFTYLNQNGIPCISAPDDAAKTFCQLYQQTCALKLARECPVLESDIGTVQSAKDAMAILKRAVEEGQEILSEYDSKMVMKSFGIPIVETIVCETAAAAGEATSLTKFPCVVKLHSDTITHKSDVGGVILGVKSKEQVIEAFSTVRENCIKYASEAGFQGVTVQPMLDLSKALELLAGSISDPQFGPLVVFGSGGCMVEVYEDICTGIPPLGIQNAIDLVAQTKISKALLGCGNARFPGVKVDDLYATLINFSNMVASVQEYVTEIEINPLLAFEDRVVAVDARIVIRGKDAERPVGLIIKPYPKEYASTFTDKKGEALEVRVLKESDAAAYGVALEASGEVEFNERFLGRTREDVLKDARSATNPDYNTNLPLTAFDSSGKIAGIARVHRVQKTPNVGDLRVLVFPGFSRRGIGSMLVDRIKAVCLKEGFDTLVSPVSGSNNVGKLFMEKEGFVHSNEAEKVVVYRGAAVDIYRFDLLKKTPRL